MDYIIINRLNDIVVAVNIQCVILHAFKYAVDNLDLSKTGNKMNRVGGVGCNTVGTLVKAIFNAVKRNIFRVHSENSHARSVEDTNIFENGVLRANDKNGTDIPPRVGYGTCDIWDNICGKIAAQYYVFAFFLSDKVRIMKREAFL
jgi:hypothetical protein